MNLFEPAVKQCSNCRALKPLREFNRSSTSKDGLQSWCRACHEWNYYELRAATIAAYGDRCACCGETEYLFLDLDHIDNDGAQHRRSFGNGAAFYIHLRNQGYPPGLQVLCGNCHNAKTRKGYCPHTRASKAEEAV